MSFLLVNSNKSYVKDIYKLGPVVEFCYIINLCNWTKKKWIVIYYYFYYAPAVIIICDSFLSVLVLNIHFR